MSFVLEIGTDLKMSGSVFDRIEIDNQGSLGRRHPHRPGLPIFSSFRLETPALYPRL